MLYILTFQIEISPIKLSYSLKKSLYFFKFHLSFVDSLPQFFQTRSEGRELIRADCPLIVGEKIKKTTLDFLKQSAQFFQTVSSVGRIFGG